MELIYKKTDALINKKFRDLFFPTLITTATIYLGNIMSGIIVGNLITPEAMASIYACMPLNQLATAISYLIATSFGMVAVALGARQNEKANYIFSTILTLSIIFAMLMLFLLLPFQNELAGILSRVEELHEDIQKYLSVFIIRTALIIVISVWRYVLRTEGLVKIIKQSAIFQQIISIILTIIFVGYFYLGVRGAAYALIISDIFSAIYMLAFYYKSAEMHNLKFVNVFHDGFKKFFIQSMSIFKTGAPASIVIALAAVKVWAIYQIVGTLGGSSAMIFYAICVTCLSVANMFVAACGDSSLPIIGMLYGEKDFVGTRLMLKNVQKFTLFFIGIVVAFILFSPETLLKIYNLPVNNFESGALALRIFSISLLGVAFSGILIYYYTVIQQRSAAAILSISEGIFTPPLAWILSNIWGINGVWVAFILTEIISFIVIFFYTKFIIKSEDYILIDKADPKILYDVSITANLENAVKISEESINVLKNNFISAKTAVKVGVALEEIILNIAKISSKKSANVDVRIKINENQNATIILRDNGKIFNPVEYNQNDSENFLMDGIKVMKSLTKNIQYNRILGLNQTVIEI